MNITLGSRWDYGVKSFKDDKLALACSSPATGTGKNENIKKVRWGKINLADSSCDSFYCFVLLIVFTLDSFYLKYIL